MDRPDRNHPGLRLGLAQGPPQQLPAGLAESGLDIEGTCPVIVGLDLEMQGPDAESGRLPDGEINQRLAKSFAARFMTRLPLGLPGHVSNG